MFNSIKNLFIILDFLVSIVASAIQKSYPSLSQLLFMVSAILLFVAFICVIIDISRGKKKK